ncbi:AAA family ATPase [Ezakiella peruensis]|uniref:AAA family ATPase n=1 Tax=Ezakiella peruensis TaxID=1464038 RepID=UPI001FE4B06E|nr:AAA family ATPase [Ezakiella peruensis]
MEKQFQWTYFYMELASKLLEYKDKRAELLDILKDIYKTLNMDYPFKEKGQDDYDDICPFTVFASFNKRMNDVNRIALLEEFAKRFSVKAEVPKTLDGIPVVMPLNAWFFAYKGNRKDDDVDNLWDFFAKALTYADNNSAKAREDFVEKYDVVIKQKGVKWNITMGLYWIRPYTFMSLDSVSRDFFKYINNAPQDFVNIIMGLKEDLPDGETYLSICQMAKAAFSSEDFSYKSFPALSYGAWLHSKTTKINSKGENYWIYSPGENACKWEEFYEAGIMGIGWDRLSDLKTFKSREKIQEKMKVLYNSEKEPTNDSLCLWQFANEIKVGDIIFAKKGRNTIIGKGEVTSDYIYDENREDFKHIRKVNWTDKGERESEEMAPMKTLTCITEFSDYLKSLQNLFRGKVEPETPPTKSIYETYTKEDFLNEVYMDEDAYTTLANLLDKKLNIILQGAPGVGKTFVAERLAYSLMGEKDVSRVAMVQFHQSYSYEDFIQGYRPSKDGFELVDGVFYKFCKRAEEDEARPYFFIIDEINRGNLSKILGELMMLIENDKRGEKIKMLYSDEWFSVPKNIHIIGMMNTADRSLALMDYALRRRFAFFDFPPAFESQGFKNYLAEKNSPKLNRLITSVLSLNNAIQDDESLGEGFRIGHSYFCNDTEITDSWLKSVVEYEIIPLIKEYWFDEPSKVLNWSSILRDAIK